MRKKIIIPVRAPRNKVVLAIMRLSRMGSGRHTTQKRVDARDHADLAQRVREVGEW